MDASPFICPRCGTITSTDSESSLKCGACNFTISSEDYTKIIDFGSKVILYGIYYRREYQRDFEKHGKLTAFCAIAEPTVALSFVGGVIAGIVSNASYDALKFIFKRLFSSLSKMKIESRKPGEEKPFASTTDLDVLYRLLGEDEEYANQFYSDIQDYLEGMPGLPPVVRNAIAHEEAIHREVQKHQELMEKALASSELKDVYVTRSGKKYHLKNCRLLNGAKRRISLDDAKRKYSPCRTCKPG